MPKFKPSRKGEKTKTRKIPRGQITPGFATVAAPWQGGQRTEDRRQFAVRTKK
jgi:hypothetical protein